ncbi:unnamed protein product [Heterobilharzia americana]|nr:unnamed protein product [Heterobilharzia americana]
MMLLNILLALGGQESDSAPVFANTEVSLLRQFDKVTYFQSPGTFLSFQIFCNSGVNMSAAVVSASAVSAFRRISTGSAALTDFSSFMALRTSTFVRGFVFTRSSGAGMLVVFVDEVQVVVESRAL